MKIELKECPVILQEAVEKFLKENSGKKIIYVSKRDSTPYMDKSIVSTTFRVSIQEFNLFTSFTYFASSDPDSFDLGVIKDSMNAGQIIDIIKNAEEVWF